MKIRHQLRLGGRNLRHIQREQPGLTAGLHDDAVAERLTNRLPLRRLGKLRSVGLRPATAVEAFEGHRAPVELVARRNVAGEGDTEGQLRRTNKTGDLDRKSVGSGKSVSVRVDIGGLRISKKKKT